MRPVRKISDQEENLRFEEFAPGCVTMKRDMVAPEPVGTLILMAFRITGYGRDCDGSALAHLEQIGGDGEATGWETNNHCLYPGYEVVITEEELKEMFSEK